MAYDSEADQAILFGGEGSPQSGMIGGTWAYDFSAHQWHEIALGPGPEQGAAGDLAYDIQSDRVIMFVGSYFFGVDQSPQGRPASETWAFAFDSDSWKAMQPTASPPGLAGARIAYDIESDRMILFGGADPDNFQLLNQTWAYDFDTDSWQEMNPASRPPPMNFHSMAYDNASDRIILLGTSIAEGMWAYDFNIDTWQPLHPAQMPPFRAYSSMIYDAGSGQVVLFGGASTPTEEPLSDMWTYNAADNTWTELTPDTRPAARGWHAAVYNEDARLVLLFGGGPDRESFTAETWVYEPARSLWYLEPATP